MVVAYDLIAMFLLVLVVKYMLLMQIAYDLIAMFFASSSCVIDVTDHQ